MIHSLATPPPGYAGVRVGGVEAVALSAAAPAIRAILATTTLYDHAAAHPARRAAMGRAAVYIIPLEGVEEPVVVRHAWHGGSLAPITGDRFVAPTRAPYELEMSLRLAGLGVATPRVVAYAIYPAGPKLRRSDVVTAEIGGGADLATILSGASSVVPRSAAIAAAGDLLAAMARAGVRHPDLNLKNILVAPGTKPSAAAYLLDVDRVIIEETRARAAAANAARLTRSARKWRRQRGAPISDADVEALEAAALGSTA